MSEYDVDYKEISEEVNIGDVADHLKLVFIKGRARCPACESDNALELKLQSNTFICYAGEPRKPHHKHLSGDCITLYAHIMGYRGNHRAAKDLKGLFMARPTGRPTVPTPPPSQEGRTAQAQPAPTKTATAQADRVFDPEKFWLHCIYTDELAAAGLSEEDAARLRIGYHTRYKAHYQAARNPDGSVSGFVRLPDDLRLVKFPDKSQWLLSANIVRLKRPA